MKYVLEFLDNYGRPIIYGSRAAVISALDAYLRHRPGQIIAATYVDGTSNKSILAVGNAYGRGKDDGSTVRRYTILEECDHDSGSGGSVQPVSQWAEDVFIRTSIDYSNLLLDMEDVYGVARFGYLGTSDDPWINTKKIPAGTSVKKILDEILTGNRIPIINPNSISSLQISSSPQQITVPETGLTIYNVFSSISFTGELASAVIEVLDENSVIVKTIDVKESFGSTNQYSITEYVGSDYDLDPGQNRILKYRVTATVGTGCKSVTSSNSVTVTIIKEESPETPVTYTLRYHLNSDGTEATGTNETEPRNYNQGLITLPTVPYPAWNWVAQSGYEFVGWSSSSAGSDRITTVNTNSFVGDDTVKYFDSYAVWAAIQPKQLRTNSELYNTFTYNGNYQTFDTSSVIVRDSDGNLVNSSDYEIQWTGGSALSGKTVSESPYTGAFTIVSRSERYTDSVEYQAELSITKANAVIGVLIDNSHESTIYLNGTVYNPSVYHTNFFGTDADSVTMDNTYWDPALDTSSVGDYYLKYNQNADPYITANYNVQYIDSLLHVILEPHVIDVRFTTKNFDNEKAVALEDLESTGWDDAAAAYANTDFEDKELYWFLTSDIDPSDPSNLYDITTIQVNEILNVDNLKIYNPFISSWAEVEQSDYSVEHNNGTTTVVLYQPIDNMGDPYAQKCLLAIKFTE